MKIYIACSLTHVPRNSFASYSLRVHELAAALRRERVDEVSYALLNSDPQLASIPFAERARLCYKWDRELVEKSELVIAEASYPSTGLGIELQVAAEVDIPVIICFSGENSLKANPIEYENPDHKRYNLQIGEGHVSLMALGLPNIFKVIRYFPTEDWKTQIIQAVDALRESKSFIRDYE